MLASKQLQELESHVQELQRYSKNIYDFLSDFESKINKIADKIRIEYKSDIVVKKDIYDSDFDSKLGIIENKTYYEIGSYTVDEYGITYLDKNLNNFSKVQMKSVLRKLPEFVQGYHDQIKAEVQEYKELSNLADKLQEAIKGE